jgi:cytochrome b
VAQSWFGAAEARYAHQARERYPPAEQYYREGRRAISQRTAENPLLSLLLAAAIGYALARIGHGQRRRRNEPVSEYARTSRGYAPHRDERLKR